MLYSSSPVPQDIGDRVLKVKLQRDHQGGPSSNLTSVLVRNQEDHVKTQEKSAICKPRREASEEINLAKT
jgi:hypothetical protein